MEAMAKACTLKVFGLSVSQVLESAPDGRDLDVVELWSGVGSIVSAAKAAGLAAAPFDKHRDHGVTDTADPSTTEDILLEAGFLRALGLVLRLRLGGLLWMAPVCSSWIFLNLAQTKRTRLHGPKFSGDERYVPVQQGNQMAEIAAFLFLIAALRGVHAVIENPAGSMMFSYEAFATACGLWRERFWAVVPYCSFSTANLGERLGKRFKLMGTHPWVRRLALPCLCPGRVHKALHTLKFVNGKRRVTGCKQALKDSAAYPPNMGTAIIDAWMNNLDKVATCERPASKSKVHAQQRRARPAPWTTRAQSAASASIWAAPAAREGPTRRMWASLPLEDAPAIRSSTRRKGVAGKARPRRIWAPLSLEDAPDLDVSVTPLAAPSGTGNSWQTSALEGGSDSDPRAPHCEHQWRRLSLDD